MRKSCLVAVALLTLTERSSTRVCRSGTNAGSTVIAQMNRGA